MPRSRRPFGATARRSGLATLACTSNNALAQYNLGLALADAGHADGAILHFTNAVTIKPDYVAAHNNLGVALSPRGRFGEAIAEYDKALKIRPDYAAAHVNLGVAFARQKKSAEAMAEYHTALQLDPDYADAYDNLGVVLYDRGRPGCGRGTIPKGFGNQPRTPTP